MTKPDVLANGLMTIEMNSKLGKRKCVINMTSKLLGNVLSILQREGYIGQFEYIDDGRFGKYVVELLGKITRCRAIKPRFNIKHTEIERYEQHYLPGKDIGVLILSTSKGLLTSREAKKMRIGGALIAYCY